MKAKIAYLTSPAPGMFLLNFQQEQGIDFSVEISKGHLANILIDGCALALRDSSKEALKLNPANEAFHVERAE